MIKRNQTIEPSAENRTAGVPARTLQEEIAKPLVHVNTNCAVSADTERALKSKIADAIAHLWFGGSDAPAAFAEVRLFGRASDADYDRVTAALTDALADQLHVAPDRVYIPYQEVSHWGWNGGNF